MDNKKKEKDILPSTLAQSHCTFSTCKRKKIKNIFSLEEEPWRTELRPLVLMSEEGTEGALRWVMENCKVKLPLPLEWDTTVLLKKTYYSDARRSSKLKQEQQQTGRCNPLLLTQLPVSLYCPLWVGSNRALAAKVKCRSPAFQRKVSPISIT